MRHFEDPIGGEYEVVSLRPGWGGVSILVLVATFGASVAGRWIPWPLGGAVGWRVWMMPAASAVGVVCALVGVRRASRVARVGLLLNAAVLAWTLLVAAGFVYLRFLR